MARYNGRIIVGVGGKQQQADWNESDSNSPSYIKNKPNIDAGLHYEVVNELPTEDIDTNCVYLVPSTDPQQSDVYNEYMYIDNAWEKIGSTGMAQVQSDWDESDTTSPAYIDNKPNNLDLVVPFTVNGSTVSTTVSTSDIMSAITAGQGVYATLDGLYLPLTVFQNTTPEKIIFSEVIDGIESIITGKEVSGVWTWTLTENDLNNTTSAWYGTQAEYDMLGADALIEGKDYYIETELAKVATTGLYADLKGNKPTAPVAYSNEYKDLSNVPTPTQSTYFGRQDLDWYGTQAEFDALEQAGQLEFYRNYYIENALAQVATSGSYNDLTDKPTIPTCNNKYDLSTKSQAELVDFYTNYATIMDTNTLFWGDYPVVSVGTYTDPQLGITAVLVEYNPFAISSVFLGGAYHTLSAGVKSILPDGSIGDASTTMKLADSDHLATVATTGSYTDLSNKPTNLVTGYNGASYTIRYISQTDYDNLGTYDANTIYLIY